MFVFGSCNNSTETKDVVEYPNRIGDITVDPDLDDPDFTVCDEDRILQHYAPYLSGLSMLYEGDKPAIVAVINSHYPSVSTSVNGYITTRFVVNCNGETDRFRTEQMSLDYKKKSFDQKLLKSINDAIRSLDKWKSIEVEGKRYDYYVYLSIHIEGGKIVNIRP